MLGKKRQRGTTKIWWGLFLFFAGLMVWGLFWGIPDPADLAVNGPVALMIERTSSLDFPSALFFTYLVMGWACVAIGFLGLVTLVGAKKAKIEAKNDVDKARHIHILKKRGTKAKTGGWW